MTRSPAPRRGLLAAVIALVAGALGLALVPAGSASASLGSVPADVTAYVTSGAMVARLTDVYGPNASGTAGIKFDDTTKAGPISRVYEWTAVRLTNHATDHPVQLTNNWVVPITIAGASVGLATIWINPQTVDAELAEFTPSAALGTALTTVPATAALVRDTTTGAWLGLADGKVTPLIAGKSGLTGPVPVESLKLSPASAAPIVTTEPNTGLALAIGIVGLIVIVIVVALLLPRRRGAKKDAQAATPSATPPATPTKPEAATSKPATAKPAPVKPAGVEPATVKPATTKPATPKPAGPRPSGRTPTTSSAAKPASSKPPVSRPASSKSTASKSPSSKPPLRKQPPRPRTPKPPADPASDGSA